MLVSSSMSADSRSTTSTIPNGAGQSPSRYTPMTPVGSCIGSSQQGDRDADEREGRGDVDCGLDVAAPLAAKRSIDRAGQQRQQHGRDDQVVAQAAHGSGSRPSTWSVPVRPRDASSTTRNSAVVAKLMTIAVRTSACGSGSAYCEGSPVARIRQGREALRPQPSHGEDEEIDGIGEQRQADDHLERARPQDQPNARARERSDAEGEDRLPSSHLRRRRSAAAGARDARRAVASHRLMRERDQHQHGRADDEREHAEIEQERARQRNGADQGNSR